MIKNSTYVIPHTCYLCEWSTPDDGGYEIFGAYPQYTAMTYDRVIEVKGFRCIGLVERVRDHWVVDTWLECCEGETSSKVKLLSHKYLSKLLRGAKLWGE